MSAQGVEPAPTPEQDHRDQLAGCPERSRSTACPGVGRARWLPRWNHANGICMTKVGNRVSRLTVRSAEEERGGDGDDRGKLHGVVGYLQDSDYGAESRQA